MTALKWGLKIDTFLQGLTILLVLFSLAAELLGGNEEWLLTYFVALGAMQIFSAIIFSYALGDEKRGMHIIYALMYFLTMPLAIYLGGSILYGLDYILGLDGALIMPGLVAYVIGIPVFLAFSYFKFTVRDIAKVNLYHRYYWNL